MYDESGKFNLDLIQINGSLLIVSQFTLAADYRKGRRPSFKKSAPPDVALKLYNFFIQECRRVDIEIETGIFAASMKVSLVNDGPVTMIIDSYELKNGKKQ